MPGNYGAAQQRGCSVNSVNLCYFEWGEPGLPQLLLVHATGFHGRCWDQVVAALPAGFHVIAPEMRGHGRSERRSPYDWASFGADLVAFADALGLEQALAAGHSMGGHCLLQLAIARPAAVGGLLLIDPVVFEPEAYSSDRFRQFSEPQEHPVARRRNHWSDWQAMRASLIDKGSFGLWAPAVLDDYCRYGCLPLANGVELACPPLVEASVYLGNTSSDVHTALASVQTPATVLRAPPADPSAAGAMDFSKSPTWPGLAAALGNGEDVLLADLTHFIPMQAPALVATYIEKMAASLD